MDWLNYHHLLYFWMAAREGSITKACRALHLTQPTVSGQIRALERALKVRLFERSGRTVALTDTGRLVYRYADEIFSLGRELQDALHDRPHGQPLRFAVGVADTLPGSARDAGGSPHGRVLTASSNSRRLTSWIGWPISCRRRGSIGIATMGCLRRITSSGGP